MNDFFSIVRKSNGTIIWSEDQIDYIIKDYQNNFSTGQLANKFSCSTDAIRRLLKKNKIKILNLSELGRKDFPRNSNFFNQIDTIDKAYWLGFLYADGYIGLTNEIRINLKKDDEQHLVKFLVAIEAKNSKIHYSIKKDNDKIYHQAYIGIRDKQLVEDLINKGCFRQKSLILEFPTEEQVPYNLLSHFIRGYFDGDGSIHFTMSGNAKTPNYRISFIGTKNFLIGVQKFFNKEKLSLQHNGNYFSFQINGNKQVELILNILYKNSEEKNYLDRKKEIYNHFLLQRIGNEPINIGCE